MHYAETSGQNKQHAPKSIKKKSNMVREQPPRMFRNNNPKMTCDSAVGQHLIINPECAKTYTDDDFGSLGKLDSLFI